MVYERISLAQNNKLPVWRKCELKFGIIQIYGTPTSEIVDYDDICISVYSLSGITLMKYDFHIKKTNQDNLITQNMSKFKKIKKIIS